MVYNEQNLYIKLNFQKVKCTTVSLKLNSTQLKHLYLIWNFSNSMATVVYFINENEKSFNLYT